LYDGLHAVVRTTPGKTLRKSEILRGQSAVSELFASGKTLKSGFLRIVYAPLLLPASTVDRSLPQVMFVVSKRNVPRAVRRNRIKRLMREAYRHKKLAARKCVEKLVSGSEKRLCIAFVYTGRYGVLPGVSEFRKEIVSLFSALARCSD